MTNLIFFFHICLRDDQRYKYSRNTLLFSRKVLYNSIILIKSPVTYRFLCHTIFHVCVPTNGTSTRVVEPLLLLSQKVLYKSIILIKSPVTYCFLCHTR